jgi:plasmid stabilization system protein ParE
LAYKIIWTHQADFNLKKVFLYLHTNWSEKDIDKFLDTLDMKLINISKMPFIGKRYKNETSTRSLVVVKQVKLFYQINKDAIEILNIFDTRQNPDSRPF